MKLYIIYATRDGMREAGIAEHFDPLGYWWCDARYPVDAEDKAGPLQKTIDRLLRRQHRIIESEEEYLIIKPKSYTGRPFRVIVVEEAP